MFDATLCLPHTENAVLLGMKKRGFGKGRWNGMGGKLKEGETIRAAAVRELEEEIGIKASERDLKQCATLDFYFAQKPEWDTRVHVFLARAWEGEPAESEEMRPQWFPSAEIPFDKMWPDDQYWLPLVLKGKTLRGTFHFSDNGNTISQYKVTEAERLENS